MLAKAFILICMVIIIIALGSGLFFLVYDEGKTKRTVTSLTFRIALSLLLFILLFVAFHFGIIQPHGIQNAPIINKSVSIQNESLKDVSA